MPSKPTLSEVQHAKEAAKIPQALTPEFKECSFVAYLEGEMALDTTTGEAKMRLRVVADDAMPTYLALWRARGHVFRVEVKRVNG